MLVGFAEVLPTIAAEGAWKLPLVCIAVVRQFSSDRGNCDMVGVG